MKKILGIGVIGMGMMGQIHAAEYAANPQCRLQALVDTSPAVLSESCRRYNVPGYTDHRELLARKDVQAVSICTPDDQHRQVVLDALTAGKHVLLEKPIATTMEDADAIVAAAAQTPVKLMMGHTLRFSPRYKKAKELIQDGAIGEVQSLFARRTNIISVPHRLAGRVSLLAFLGVHDLDIMRWMAESEVVKVYCEVKKGLLAAQGYDVEDVVFTTLRFASGAIGCGEFGWILPVNHPSGHDFRLDITGTHGALTIDEAHDGLSVAGVERYIQPPVQARTAPVVAAFLECILLDKKPPVTAEDGREALRIAIAAQKSAAIGLPVDLVR